MLPLLFLIQCTQPITAKKRKANLAFQSGRTTDAVRVSGKLNFQGGVNSMNRNTFWGLAACLIVPVLTGCANQGTIRGQSPGEMTSGVIMPQPQFQEAGFSGDMNSTYISGGEVVVDGTQVHVTGGWPNCNCCDWRCDGACGYGLYPKHHHTVKYCPPEGLQYPPANQPPAVVQYPYYTVKGPSDFFMK